MKIAILEDEKVESTNLIKILKEWSLKNHLDIEIFLYASGEEFFAQNKMYLSENIAVFLLDIQMKEMNGVDVAKRLRREGYKGEIIFLTAFREYVFKGYEVHALNYLLKPVNSKALCLCLDEIAKELMGNSYLYRNKKEIISIPYKEIISFSTNLHYVDILTTKECYQQYSTLSAIIEHLPKEFIRVHKSCIVNLSHIRKITKNIILLSNRKTTTIGRVYMKNVIDAFMNYSIRFDGKGEGV